jgi:hypothetical protein
MWGLVPPPAEVDTRSEASVGNSGSGEKEKRQEAEELAGDEERPLVLPTPSFMASAEEE